MFGILTEQCDNELHKLWNVDVHVDIICSFFKVATTSCTDVGCNIDRGGVACGYYQIHYEYYIDCYKPEPGKSIPRPL